MTSPPSPRVFVMAVAHALGLDPKQKTALAKALNLPPHHASKRVTRWLEGGTGPDYDGMIAMLTSAGWLTEDAWAHLRAAEEQAQRAEDQARRLGSEQLPPEKRATG